MRYKCGPSKPDHNGNHIAYSDYLKLKIRYTQTFDALTELICLLNAHLPNAQKVPEELTDAVKDAEKMNEYRA